MQSEHDSYSPSECVRLLEEAQCGDEHFASCALRSVAQGLRAPHASVSAAALELLVVHPSATIPHIPDLISGNAEDVAAAVTAFGHLLPTDRGLLVPILGALSEMPLSRSDEENARATLRFALDTVDGDDIPVVARALLRCAGSLPLARWAVATLRAALRRELSPHVGALLAHVVAEHACTAGPIGRALRSAAGDLGVSPIDIVVWIVCLQRSQAGTENPAAGAAAAITSCVRSGAFLSGDLPVLLRALTMLGPVAEDMPQGIVALISSVVSAFSEHQLPCEVFSAVILVRLLLSSCPATINHVMAELARTSVAGGYPGRAAETILLGLSSSVLIRGIRVNFVSPNAVPNVAVTLAMHGERNNQDDKDVTVVEGSDSQAWNEIFLRMRKGLIFGSVLDKVVACSLAYSASCKAGLSVMKQVVTLMDSVIANTLTDCLATSFLLVLGNAVFRGAIDPDVAAELFEKRVKRQVPNGLFSIVDESFENRVTDNDAKVVNSQDSCAPSVSVDIAVIKDKAASAVSTVVGSGLALLCHQMGATSSVKSVWSLVSNASVLVPTVCLPLYEAAQTITSDAEATDGRDSKAVYERDDTDFQPAIPEHLQKIRAMSDAKFQEALKGCMTGIWALIGVVNMASTSLPIIVRVLRVRHEGMSNPSRKAYQDDLWALHDRVSELLVMVHAISLGLDEQAGLSQHLNSDDDSEEEGDMRHGMTRQIPEVLKHRLTQTLLAHQEPCHSETITTTGSAYPVLTLSAVISALVSIPDPKGMENLDENAYNIAERDPAFGRMEEFLLRRLVCLSQGPAAPLENQSAPDGGVHDGEGTSGALTLPPLDDEERAAVLRALDDPDANLDDIFYGDPSDNEEEAPQARKKKRRKSIVDNMQWACPLPVVSEALPINFLFDVHTSDMFGREAGPSHVLYSPEFAALLLDRAAVNAVAASVKRRTLQRSGKMGVLKALNAAVGFSLRVFAHILMNIPTLMRMGLETGLHRLDEARPVHGFVSAAGQHMMAQFPSSKESIFFETEAPGAEATGQRKVVGVLEWVNKKSIDVATSVLALDCLALLAEHGVLHSGHTRELMLHSSSIVHEYEESALWSPSDFSLLFRECCQDWITRRRQAGIGPVFEDELAASGPWQSIDSPAISKTDFLGTYRLRMVFNGLCLEDAGREACGWAERLLVDVQKTQKEKHGKRDAFALPRLGVYTILDFLLAVCQAGLPQVRGGHEFSLSAACAAQTKWFVRTLRGIVGVLEHLQFDSRFAHLLSVLFGHSRQAVDTLAAQYSGARTNVPDLDRVIVDDLQEVSVVLAEAADGAGKLAAQLKNNSVASAMEGKMRSAVLRVRNAIPRLQTQTEAARRSAAALAKAVGKALKIRKTTVGDGVRAWRIRTGGAVGSEAPLEEEEEEAEEDEVMQEGFHSTAGGESTVNTVVVSFRNAR